MKKIFYIYLYSMFLCILLGIFISEGLGVVLGGIFSLMYKTIFDANLTAKATMDEIIRNLDKYENKGTL